MRKPISKVFLGGDHSRQIGVVHGAAGGHRNAKRAELDEKNAALKKSVHALETILATGIARDAHVAVGDWRREPTVADLPDELQDRPHPEHADFDPPPLGLLERLIPGAAARHAAAVAEAEKMYEAAVAEWDDRKVHQADALAALEAEIRQHNHHLEEVEARLKAGDPEAVQWYAHKVLSRSPYPRLLPRKIEVAFDPRDRTITARLDIPDQAALIPSAQSYRYDKPQDEIIEVHRSEEDRADLYHQVVAQLSLRTLHEVFGADVGGCIDAISLLVNAIVVDPSTGRESLSPLVDLATTRAAFAEINLAKAAPIPCLERLTRTGASGVSPHERPNPA